MRIDPTHASQVTGIAARSTSAPAGPAPQQPASARRPDAVELSGGAGLVRRAHAAAGSAPDARAERVAEIKAQVQSGTYTVDNQALAEKLLHVL
jgi:negative regulator of flagellin synthesis FlgM